MVHNDITRMYVNLHLWPEHGYVYCLQPAGSAEDVELPTLLNQVATKQPALNSCEVAKLQSCKSSCHHLWLSQESIQ